MLLIDTHAHVYEPQFDADRKAVIDAAKEVGVAHLVLPNIDVESLPRLFDLKKDLGDYASIALGLHPTSVKDDYLKELNEIEACLDRVPICAIGEIGMDLYWDKSFMDQQMHALSIQLSWALERNLPVIIHAREAFELIFECIRRCDPHSKLKGVFHSFTGTEKELQEALAMPGFMLGINGVLTYKNAHLRELIAQIPTDRLLLETDAPYLAPVPKRGRRNEPAFLLHTARYMAALLGIELDRLAKETTDNAVRLFGICLSNHR